MIEHSNHIAERNTFGFWVYLMSDCILFAALFAAYAVLWRSTFGGATIYAIANLNFVFIETMLLLTSSFTIGLARIFADSKKNIALALLLATLLLGLSFLGMELSEFSRLIAEGNGPQRSAFLSSFFALVGTHGLHVFVGSIWMIVLGLRSLKAGFSESVRRKLALLSLFWHFLDVIWIFIFTFVYLFGALGL